jgi:hypothetical protein
MRFPKSLLGLEYPVFVPIYITTAMLLLLPHHRRNGHENGQIPDLPPGQAPDVRAALVIRGRYHFQP